MTAAERLSFENRVSFFRWLEEQHLRSRPRFPGGEGYILRGEERVGRYWLGHRGVTAEVSA